jgi:hypothetical protein
MRGDDRLADIAAIAAYGLTGSARMLPATSLEDAEWKALLAGVQNQRLTGFLVRAVSDDALALTPQQRRQATEAHAQARCLVQLLEGLLLELVDHLEAEHIDYRVLKGAAAAHLIYSQPWLRSYGDIDLLIPAQQLDAALTLLADLGCYRDRPQPRPRFDQRFGKGVTLLSPDGYPVDLHRTLAEGPFAQHIRQPELFATSSPFSLGGRSLRALGAEENFLHACLHAVLGDAPARLVPLRDLAQMLQTVQLDLDRIYRLASSWKAAAVVARAVCTAWSVFQLEDGLPIVAWAHQYRPSRSQKRTLKLYPKVADNYAVMALAELSAVPGIRGRAAYLRAQLLPDRSYLDARSIGHLARWRHAARILLSWRGIDR